MSSSANSGQYPWLRDYPDHLDWEMDIPVRSMVDVFDETVAEFGDRPGFDFLGKHYSWAEMGALTDKFAAGLQRELGIKKGDKVGLFLPNSPIFLIAYYGVLKIGATVVNYNPLYAEDELAYQIEDSETDIMVTLDLQMLYEKADKMLHGTRLKRLILCKFTDILPFPKSLLFPVFKRSECARVAKDKRILWFHDLTSGGADFTPVKIDPLRIWLFCNIRAGRRACPRAQCSAITASTPMRCKAHHGSGISSAARKKCWACCRFSMYLP